MNRLTYIIVLIFLVLYTSNVLPEEDVHMHLNLSISVKNKKMVKVQKAENEFGEKSKPPDSQNRFFRTCSCGKAPKTRANRIIGGLEAIPNEFPWMVRIVGGCAMASCGGALISPRLVVSSYHCSYPQCNHGGVGCNRFRWPWDGSAPCNHRDEQRIAILGQHRDNPYRRRFYYSIPIIDVKYPKHGYQQFRVGQYSSHDLAIMVLKHAARFSDKINSICLPKPGQDFSGKMAVTAGWGAFAPPHIKTEQSEVLRKVNLQVSNKKYNHYNMFGTKLEKKHRWGLGRGSFKDPCAGDSGGPLMYWNRRAQHYVLIGTVHGKGYDCTSGKVRKLEGSTNGVWNKVSNWVNYIRWLMRSMGETACQSSYF